jgi:hypothetical protein
MIASLDNRLWLADVLGSLLLWVKFLSPEGGRVEKKPNLFAHLPFNQSRANLRVFFCVTSEARKDGYGVFLS